MIRGRTAGATQSGTLILSTGEQRTARVTRFHSPTAPPYWRVEYLTTAGQWRRATKDQAATFVGESWIRNTAGAHGAAIREDAARMAGAPVRSLTLLGPLR